MKGFGLIGIVIGAVLLVIVGGGAYYLGVTSNSKNLPATSSSSPTDSQTTPSSTPTVDSAANWQTYTDPILKFSFKYPNTYKVSSSGFAPGTFMVSINDGPSRVFTYLVYDNEDKELPKNPPYNDFNNVKKAIETGSTDLLMQHVTKPEEKSTILVKNFGGQNFLKVSPYSYDGCFCSAIEYITVINNKVVDIGIAKLRMDGPMENLTPNNKSFKEQYGYDPDEIMATFKVGL